MQVIVAHEIVTDKLFVYKEKLHTRTFSLLTPCINRQTEFNICKIKNEEKKKLKTS